MSVNEPPQNERSPNPAQGWAQYAARGAIGGALGAIFGLAAHCKDSLEHTRRSPTEEPQPVILMAIAVGTTAAMILWRLRRVAARGTGWYYGVWTFSFIVPILVTSLPDIIHDSGWSGVAMAVFFGTLGGFSFGAVAREFTKRHE